MVYSSWFQDDKNVGDPTSNVAHVYNVDAAGKTLLFAAFLRQ